MKDIARTAGRNILVLVAFWLAMFVFIRIGGRISPSGVAGNAAEVIACITGIALAIVVHARVALYLLSAMTAFSVSEFVIHTIYGIQVAQGAPTHLAVIGAGAIGVLLGAVFTSHKFTSSKDLFLSGNQSGIPGYE